MTKRDLLISLLCVLAAAACSPGEQQAGEPRAETASAAEDRNPDVSLTNTYWKLVELNGAAIEPGEGKELHMMLRGDDQVSGYSGCNQFTGSVTVSADGLAFGPIAGTRRMCERVMDQEYAFLQALEAARRFDIDGESLAIENATGEISMRFVAVYMQ